MSQGRTVVRQMEIISKDSWKTVLFVLGHFVLTLTFVVCVVGGRGTGHYMNDGISVKKTWHREVAGF